MAYAPSLGGAALQCKSQICGYTRVMSTTKHRVALYEYPVCYTLFRYDSFSNVETGLWKISVVGMTQWVDIERHFGILCLGLGTCPANFESTLVQTQYSLIVFDNRLQCSGGTKFWLVTPLMIPSKHRDTLPTVVAQGTDANYSSIV